MGHTDLVSCAVGGPAVPVFVGAILRFGTLGKVPIHGIVNDWSTFMFERRLISLLGLSSWHILLWDLALWSYTEGNDPFCQPSWSASACAPSAKISPCLASKWTFQRELLEFSCIYLPQKLFFAYIICQGKKESVNQKRANEPREWSEGQSQGKLNESFYIFSLTMCYHHQRA